MKTKKAQCLLIDVARMHREMIAGNQVTYIEDYKGNLIITVIKKGALGE